MKQKISVEIYKSGSENDSILRMVANVNEGKAELEMKRNKTLVPSLLADSHYGVYIPQLFCAELLSGTYKYENIPFADIQYIADPANMGKDDYFDIWIEISDNIVLIDLDGDKYTIIQNGDLWAIPEGYELSEDFFIN